jgi:hypothetical protein
MRSRRHGFWAGIVSIVNRHPYKCRVCHQRFYRSSDWLKPEALPVRSRPVAESAFLEVESAPQVQADDNKKAIRTAVPGIARPVAKWAGIILAFSLAAYGVYYFWPAYSGVSNIESPLRQFVIEEGINRYGGDYFSFGMREASAEACAAECVKNSNCRAFTVVKPLIPGAAAICWLKSTALAALPDSCCISGVRTQ